MSNVNIKTRVYSDRDALRVLKRLENKRILIVCDKFLVQSGTINFCLEAIGSSNQTEVFDDTVPDPTMDVVIRGVKRAAQQKPQIVIGFGGGSAIDTAKAILYFGEAGGFFKKEKFITIPTTSGTGSEVTSVAVITDTEQKRKNVIEDPSVLADVAILDARLTLSVPKAVTANTGMDVLTHALEAYVATDANVFSDALAEKSVELILKSLLQCYYHGDDMEARTDMHEASTLAGMAFNTAGLGVNHGIAHQLGGTLHIPHGLANAILLREVIAYNSTDPEVLKKYAKLARKVGMAGNEDSDSYTVKVWCSVIEGLMRSMEMPQKISACCKITREEFEANLSLMAENALKDRCMPKTPKKIDRENVIRILKTVYE